MSRTEHAYFEKRLKREEHLVRTASCAASKMAHQKMANHYRSMVGDAIDKAA